MTLQLTKEQETRLDKRVNEFWNVRTEVLSKLRKMIEPAVELYDDMMDMKLHDAFEYVPHSNTDLFVDFCEQEYQLFKDEYGDMYRHNQIGSTSSFYMWPNDYDGEIYDLIDYLINNKDDVEALDLLTYTVTGDWADENTFITATKEELKDNVIAYVSDLDTDDYAKAIDQRVDYYIKELRENIDYLKDDFTKPIQDALKAKRALENFKKNQSKYFIDYLLDQDVIPYTNVKDRVFLGDLLKKHVMSTKKQYREVLVPNQIDGGEPLVVNLLLREDTDIRLQDVKFVAGKGTIITFQTGGPEFNLQLGEGTLSDEPFNKYAFDFNIKYTDNSQIKVLLDENKQQVEGKAYYRIIPIGSPSYNGKESDEQISTVYIDEYTW